MRRGCSCVGAGLAHCRGHVAMVRSQAAVDACSTIPTATSGGSVVIAFGSDLGRLAVVLAVPGCRERTPISPAPAQPCPVLGAPGSAVRRRRTRSGTRTVSLVRGTELVPHQFEQAAEVVPLAPTGRVLDAVIYNPSDPSTALYEHSRERCAMYPNSGPWCRLLRFHPSGIAGRSRRPSPR